jgi:hypothetical protein
MKLQRDITLSIKHQKTLRVFPYFFIPTLNNFYFLKTDQGFLKPKLETWKHEGYVKFISKEIEVVIEYDFTSWVGVCFKKTSDPWSIYLDDLFEKMDIPFNENVLKIQENKDIEIIEAQIDCALQHASRVIKDHWDEISAYIRNVNTNM